MITKSGSIFDALGIEPPAPLDVALDRHVLAIDPGSEASAFIVFDGREVLHHALAPNLELRHTLLARPTPWANPVDVVIERIEGFGKIASRAEFRTAEWSGVFYEVASHARNVVRVSWLPRRDAKLHLLGRVAGKDAEIREVLIERFPQLAPATGKGAKKKNLGTLKSHEWAALAVAVTWFDTRIAKGAGR